MAARLPGCDKWHPDKPSRLVSQLYTSSRGYTAWRKRCKECQRITNKLRRPAFTPKPAPTYGVIPLNWKPPEEHS